MKTTLEFNLPDEKEELALALKGQVYLCAIHDILNYLRNRRKYEKTKSDKELEIIIHHIWDVLRAYKVDPFEEQAD